MTDKEKLNNLSHSLAKFDSRSESAAEEYLKGAGIEYSALDTSAMALAFSKLSEYKLEKGKSASQRMESLYDKFAKEIMGKSAEYIQSLFPAIPQLANRKFEDGKLTQKDTDELMTDASFLEFLERQFGNDSEQD